MKNPKRAYRFMQNLPEVIARLQRTDEETKQQIQVSTQELQKALAENTKAIELLHQKQADLLHQLGSTTRTTSKKSSTASPSSSGLQADNHALDGYYRAFEDKFRGSEDAIYDRLKESYGKSLKAFPKTIKALPVIDIGCGRGELLRLFKETGFDPLGIDLNESMVKRCQEMGYKAEFGDAIAYLKGLKSSSIAGVSGIHIVEHIPFEALYELLNEAFRTIAPGGFLLLETPNPENIVVGSCTFWYDSSHLKPVPPDVLEFATQYAGFKTVDVLRMHPLENAPTSKDTNLQKAYDRLYGPRDYAVFAKK